MRGGIARSRRVETSSPTPLAFFTHNTDMSPTTRGRHPLYLARTPSVSAADAWHGMAGSLVVLDLDRTSAADAFHLLFERPTNI